MSTPRDDDGRSAARKVLMIAHFFPPPQRVGTLRTEKFCRYLPEFGYRPVVLAAGSPGDADPAPGAPAVYRVEHALRRWNRALRSGRGAGTEAARGASVPGDGLSLHARADAALRHLLIPDASILWHPAAVRAGRRILREHRIHALFSTSGPETDHLVALSLKRRTGLPWVADFRDGWMFESLRASRRTSPLRRRLEPRLERAVVEGADRIVVINEPMAADLRARYPAAAGRVRVITNGYDSRDLRGLEPRRGSPAHFRIVYTGRLSVAYGDRPLLPLLAAVERARAADPELAAALRLVLVGELSADERAQVRASGAAAAVELVGAVPRADALRYQLGADVLLLVNAADRRSMSTTKLYEYMAARRPILALTGPSAAARWIRELRLGPVVDPGDVDGIEQALRALHHQWRAGGLPPTAPEGVDRFERRTLTAQLAGELNALLDGR